MSLEADIAIEGADDSYFEVHGQGRGGQGIYLAAGGAEGIADAPVKTEWTQSAFQVGGTHRHTSYDYRDVIMSFHAIEANGEDALVNESRFRQAFEYHEDEWDEDAHQARIHYTTDMSGTRSLDVLMHEAPKLDMALDPAVRMDGGYLNPIMMLRAGKPMWWEPDVMTFAERANAGTLSLKVSNPTDQPMAHRFVLTRGNWVIPDPSWVGKRRKRVIGGEHAARTIQVNVTADNGGAVIDLDNLELMVRDDADTTMLGQLPEPGKFFMHVVPPYTPETTLSVSVSNVPAGGARIECWQPRNWSRPFGLE